MKQSKKNQIEFSFFDKQEQNKKDSSCTKTFGSTGNNKPDTSNTFTETTHPCYRHFKSDYIVSSLNYDDAYMLSKSNFNELIEMVDRIKPEDNLGHRFRGLFPGILLISIFFLVSLHNVHDWTFVFGLVLFSVSLVGSIFYFGEEMRLKKELEKQMKTLTGKGGPI
jgi:hypothetical protein